VAPVLEKIGRNLKFSQIVTKEFVTALFHILLICKTVCFITVANSLLAEIHVEE